ncbi:hypothetical protein HYDPIDRAFT_135675 [Hydnomerulius pinastri MD-312]|uniref:C2H2-type domain-containing protein n=1 Tax=Hydnomerulius pinastri MD-312 TaxID=994086 RepID=A0A0C9WD00_9AGAM|nr:hypothetical protein HYDPIDRAFT_135675 [Hydnomerulius pinastri MD-312]
MSSTTVYRRQSMAQLYEKLRAQDDEDDMAWLAQFSPEDKYDEPYMPAAASPASLSTISSESASTSSPATQCSQVEQENHSDSDSSDDDLYSDSDSDVEPEALPLELIYPQFEPFANSSLIFQPNDFIVPEPVDVPYAPSVEKDLPLQPNYIPGPAEEEQKPIVASSTTLIKAASPIIRPPSPPTTRCRATRSTRSLSTKRGLLDLSNDEDEDAYVESDGDATEDEYIPSPTTNSGKRRRSTRFATAPPSEPAQSRNLEGEHAAPPAKRPRHSPLPRNVQATPGDAAASTKSNPWACPYCKWVQRNHRTPDLKRHIRTHTRLQRPAQWVCCGVPLKDAKNFELPEGAEPYAWAGEMMIGGCGKEFSRRDALKRHLDNDHITCVGNFNAFANAYDDDD